MFQRQRAAQPPQNGVRGIGAVTFDNGLGIARDDAQTWRRRHRNEFFNNSSRLIEKGIGRDDVDQSTGGRRRECHVVDFRQCCAQRELVNAMSQTPTEFGTKVSVTENQPGTDTGAIGCR